MIQAQTQTAEYWEANFSLTDSDVEQVYNRFLEAEKPLTIAQITQAVITHRVQQEAEAMRRQLKGRQVYQPQNAYAVGDELVFPVLRFARGAVTAVRDGYNPEQGKFSVISVTINGKSREFAAQFSAEHPLNAVAETALDELIDLDPDGISEQFSPLVIDKIAATLAAKPDFVRLGKEWFVKSLMAEINIGHLHLSEAVLEISGGGPLVTDEILPHLDMDPNLDVSVQRFSLNHGLLNDDRFDEVAPAGKVAWFLRRMEPDGVKQTPERLVYTPIAYDAHLLSPQLRLLEQELDDEWSEFPAGSGSLPAIFSLMFPHRWAGALPLSSRLRPLFPVSNAERQRVIFVDEVTNEEIVGWVVQKHRYVYGLKAWYEANEIPVGGFLHLAPGPEPGVIKLGFDRRRPQREWVRLATVNNNRIQFELSRRDIGCGYDDLLVVGTDTLAAIDALWRRAESHQRSLASLLVEIFPPLTSLTPQSTVHAKTLYSAINMLKRIPPGPVFAELVRNPAFQTVGDHYWMFEEAR